jgi:urease accessory protein
MSRSQPGSGILHSRAINNKTEIIRQFASYPLKFLVTSSDKHNPYLKIVYATNYGGGLVGGDVISFEVTVEDNSGLVLTSSSYNKVYKSGSSLQPSQQNISVKIGAKSLFCSLPGPTCCFKDAQFKQTQIYRLKSSESSLVVLDWYTSGRIANNESWSFGLYHSDIQVMMEDESFMRDVVRLSNQDQIPIEERMRIGELKFHIFAILILIGPQVQDLITKILATYQRKSYKTRSSSTNRNSDSSSDSFIIGSASPILKSSGAVLRIAGESAEPVVKEIKSILQPITELIGEDLFVNK